MNTQRDTHGDPYMRFLSLHVVQGTHNNNRVRAIVFRTHPSPIPPVAKRQYVTDIITHHGTHVMSLAA
jgi:hypothetical protein